MFKVRMKVGGSIFDFTERLANHTEAEVVDVDDNGTVLRIVDPSEWKNGGKPNPLVQPATIEDYAADSITGSAIPVDSPEEPEVTLENIDVDSL